MAKQLNVNLAMTADVSKAKTELQALQKQLDSLMASANRNNTSLGLSKELSNATAMAAKLKVQLESATTSTGKLDLTQFNQQLSKSGLKLKDYRTALTSLGPQGSQAFAQLTQSIMQAEVPLRRSNTLLTNFATTLKNTARWQISSSILHGFMGALQGAYGYAQDLNQSLNNIRIVTGQSVDEMARFAEQANRAAKELSTSTTAYTDAALIYYQQGLTGKAVTDRADTTIKLANVSRQSAEEVSSQLTAIWNNFADGSENLEYYADVITALGAATASSSDEIAQGLQKFASIADTVGLSYEKASAALATVVAETRQSADVVGTAFKTMFARFQGLSLGETLEDGVDLNKYSKALATVGVNILDANGHLKDMDAILDDTAEKWNQISEGQRVALAETVAGTRQYAQFMAIMNNYNKIQANQTLAANSSGTLQEQADIYAESWEAAQKRVKAAAQGVYQDLIDDKFFIEMLNTLEKIITFVDNLIDNMGGLKGVLITIGSLVTTIFSQQLTASINNIANDIKMMTPSGRLDVQNRRKEANAELQEMARGMTRNTNEGAGMSEAYDSQAQLQQTLLDKAKSLTEEEQKQAQLLIDMNSTLGKAVIQAGKEADEEERATVALQRRLERNARVQAAKTPGGDSSGVADAQKNLKAVETMSVKTESAINRLGIASTQMGKKLSAASAEGSRDLQTELKGSIEQAKMSIASMPWDDIKTGCGTAREAGRQLTDEMTKLDAITDSLSGDEILSKDQLEAALLKVQQIKQNLENIFGGIGATAEVDSLTDLGNAFEASGYNADRAGELAGQAADQFRASAESAQTFADRQANLKNVTKLTDEQIKQLGDTASNIGSVISTVGQTFMSVASAMNAIKSIGSIWSDEDLSTSEKVLQTLMAMSTMLPLVTSAVNLSGQAWAREAFIKITHKIPADNAAAASGWAALGPGLLFIGIAAAIIAGIMGIAKVIQFLTNIYNADAIEAKKAEEAAKNLADASKEAADRLNDIKTAVDGYDTAIEKLNSCTKGTEDWNKALAGVNDQVDNLLTKYPELLSIEGLYKNGQIDQEVFSNAIHQMEEQAQRAAIAANAAAQQGQVEAAQARVKSNITNASRKYGLENERYGYNTGHNNLSFSTVESDLQKVIDLNKGSAVQLADIYGILPDVTEEYAKTLLDLAQSTAKASVMMDNATQAVISSWTDSTGYELEKGSDALMARTYNNAIENFSNAIEQANKQNSGISKADNSVLGSEFDNTSFRGMSITEAFNAARGTNYQLARNGIRGTDGNRSYAFLEDGKETEYKLEEMQATIAAAAALEGMGESAESAAMQLRHADDNVKTFFAEGNLENLTQKEYQTLVENAKIKNEADAEKYLKSQGLSDENAKAFAGDFFKSLNIAWDDIIKDLPKELRGVDNLTYKSAEGVKNAYTKLQDLDDSGSMAYKFRAMLQELPADKLEKVVSAFGEVDFSNYDSVEDFGESLKKLGLDAEAWTNKILILSNAVHEFNFEEEAKAFKEAFDVVKGLNIGDTISPDDYNKLNDAVKGYFTEMEDGTYQLIGSAESLREVLTQTRRSDLLDQAGDAMQNYGIASHNNDLEGMAQAETDLSRIQSMFLATASSLEELDGLAEVFAEKLAKAGMEFDSAEYSQALIGLASQYENCTEEITKYQEALVKGDSAQIEAAESALKLSIQVGELANRYGFDVKETEEYAKRLQKDLIPAMKEAGYSNEVIQRTAVQAAVANQRLDRGLLSLNKNLDTYKKALDPANKGTAEWSKTMDALKGDLADILNVDASTLTDDFAETALSSDDLKKALDGDVEAIKNLQAAAAEEMILTISTNLEGADLDEFQSKWDYLKQHMEEGIKSGVVDQSDLVTSFNQMIEAGHMTKDQIETALAGLHVSANVKTEYVAQRVSVPTTITEQIRYPSGTDMIDTNMDGKPEPITRWRTETQTFDGPPHEVDGYVPKYTIEGTSQEDGSITEAFVPAKFSGTKASRSSTTSGGAGGKKSGGGSKGKADTSTAEKHVDEEHRYDKISKEIEGLTKQFDRLNKAKDRAFGANKIRIMEQEIVKLKQLQKSYEQYMKEVAGADYLKIHKAIQSGQNLGSLVKNGAVGGNLAKDYKALLGGTFEILSKDAAGNGKVIQKQFEGISHYLNGISVQLDEFGNIANKDDISEAIEKWWNTAYVDWWNALNGASQKLQSNLDKKSTLEAIKEYLEKHIDRYQETVEKAQDVSDKLQDTMYQIQDQIYENFRYKIDLKVEIDERSLKRIEYAIKVLGDNIYKVPEVMQAWFDKRVGDTMGTTQHLGETWKNAFYEAQSLHASGQISDEQYIQTIKDAQDGLYGCVDQLLSMNEEMREYYGNVLTHVQEEMARITDEMDHQLNTLTHLQNVLSLLGRETDFEAIGAILEGQRQMNLNSYNVAKAQVEMYKDQVAQAEQNLEALRAGGASEDALNEFKNAVLYPAQEALRAAEEEMQADFEAYLETLNAIYDNKINQIYQDSERRLAGAWGSFDEVANALSRQRALDDEYLTKTNQIYETNTLLRKLQQDMDKTDNAASKLRLKNFSDEILAMQQKERLNKTDLDIAKARYELLQAQIALEDAQNAKSTVRLQRDNEGNYGYVYTADQEQVDNAEQNVADKENDLYNLVLGQANDYTEKILQTTRERNEALKKLDEDFKNGLIKDEETYNQLKQDIITKYNDLLESEYYSYYTAIGWLDEVAATDHTEAWTSSFQDILAAGENFQGETDLLMQQTGETVDWLNQVRAEATEEAKVGTEDLKEQVGELTKANDELATKMTGEVVPAMSNVLTTAQKLTATWAAQYDQIMALINEYLSLIDVMQDAMNSMANGDDLTYDPDFDYSRAMADYLSNGGSKSDLQYTTWQKQREMKIDDMGLSQDFYGSRGEEFEKNIDTYVNNNLTGYIQEAVDKFNEANGGNTEALESNTQANTDNTEAVNNSTTASGTNTEALGANSEALGANDSVLGENTSTLESSTGTLVDSVSELENSHQESVSAIQDTVQEGSNQIGSASDTVMSAAEVVSNAAGRVAASMAAAASSISNAVSSLSRSPTGSVMSGGSAGRNTLMPMATGGYTGSWGTSGKLAILHEKELVLNKEDTANLLDVVSMVRDFSSAIDLRAGISSAASGLSSPGYAGSEQSLQQDVTIHAEFPNATNHSEIEEAFNTLINRASQYAGRLS